MNTIRSAATTQDVKDLYEHYPYPSPLATSELINDLSNAIGFLLPEDEELAGLRILDAGCGAGYRTLAIARDYPKSSVLGLDLAEAPLEVARQMAYSLDIKNVTFKHADLLDFSPAEEYDLIVSSGVIHHLTSPELGLKTLLSCLADDGIMLIWLYHCIGEYDRLLDRELTLMLWGEDRTDYQEGLRILDDLSLRLSMDRYRTQTSSLTSQNMNQLSMDVDAYLHPIVNAYSFHQAVELFERAGAPWLAINSINIKGGSKLIDLDQVSEDPYFCLTDEELFKSPYLRQKYRALGKLDKLRAIELVLKPTGFGVLAGKRLPLSRCDERVRRNIIELPCVE